MRSPLREVLSASIRTKKSFPREALFINLVNDALFSILVEDVDTRSVYADLDAVAASGGGARRYTSGHLLLCSGNVQVNFCAHQFGYVNSSVYAGLGVSLDECFIIVQTFGTAPGSYIAWLCTQTKVYAMEMPGSRYDIGNLESYEQVQKQYKGVNL